MSRDALEEAATLNERPAKKAVPAGPDSEVDQTVVRPLARPTAIGDVIAEKYRLVRTLGRGGMGRIFAADHLLLGTTVALKFMHPHLARDRGQVARFAREARAAATLKSAYSARIIDVDTLDNGELYIVMEYLDGVSLETIAVDGRGLPIPDAVRFIVQACDALAEAHSRSIIHRDVKPANLFLTKGKSGEPIIKVLDFGLAKSVVSTEGLSSSQNSTIAGQALGTPYYMSPEQITGGAVIDGRSDVWAIGTTLYELLTGHMAFPGPNAAIVFDGILLGSPTPLRVLRPEIPDTLVAIVDRCLQREVTARFQTVRELSKALESSLLVPEPVPFVAAPLGTDRFQRSSAPPALLPQYVEASPRVTSHSLPSSAPVPSVGLSPEPEGPPGPSGLQTLIAALAGPALIAIAAGVVALMMMGDSGGAPRVGAAKSPSFGVKSGDATRLKAPPAPEKPEKPRK
jgi:serine/threonine protein kinase